MAITITFTEIGSFSIGPERNLGIFDVLETGGENSGHESIAIGTYDRNTKSLEVSKLSFFDKELFCQGLILPDWDSDGSYRICYDYDEDAFHIAFSSPNDRDENKANWSGSIRIPREHFCSGASKESDSSFDDFEL